MSDIFIMISHEIHIDIGMKWMDARLGLKLTQDALHVPVSPAAGFLKSKTQTLWSKSWC